MFCEAAGDGLALRAEITAAASDNHAANFRAAAVATPTFATVGAMMQLVLTRLAQGIEKIGDRRATHGNSVLQDLAQSFVKKQELRCAQARTEARRMNFCAPKTFVGIDIANSAKKTLIEEKGFDASAARAGLLDEVLRTDEERIRAKRSEFVGERRFGKIGETAEAAGIGVTQLAGVVEGQADMRVLRAWLCGRLGCNLSGHTQMNEERCGGHVAVGGGGITNRGRETQQHKFAVTFDRFDGSARKVSLEVSGVVNEVRFAEPDRDDAPAKYGAAKAASNRFYLGKFGHERRKKNSIRKLTVDRKAQCGHGARAI